MTITDLLSKKPTPATVWRRSDSGERLMEGVASKPRRELAMQWQKHGKRENELGESSWGWGTQWLNTWVWEWRCQDSSRDRWKVMMLLILRRKRRSLLNRWKEEEMDIFHNNCSFDYSFTAFRITRWVWKCRVILNLKTLVEEISTFGGSGVMRMNAFIHRK